MLGCMLLESWSVFVAPFKTHFTLVVIWEFRYQLWEMGIIWFALAAISRVMTLYNLATQMLSFCYVKHMLHSLLNDYRLQYKQACIVCQTRNGMMKWYILTLCCRNPLRLFSWWFICYLILCACYVETCPATCLSHLVNSH